ncbi:histidinol-phosphate transaminase [Lachnospiraceae bacterium MD1]|uniref:Histidinol-phosphate aminotransferase n=1 Tax=Variimorphobacter saccharofermentans TaxID=2755051 RepID=A0A839JXJ0_9FIRM|nr:histidinol-phosphate transaminase [Variimorphobacter saccharofermentans]MBB2181937.1 histidinol-phosphate transaminase [Variimorphobacter saccharofermentans]
MKPWEKNIRKVVPYVPGEQPNKKDMVKLNTNENPYPPAPGVEKVLKDMDSDTLRLYPDPTIKLLVDELAHFYHLNSDQVFVGVGSDDVLAVAFLTFFNSPSPVLFPDITYSFYPVWCDLYRIPYEVQALDENFCIVKEDYNKPNGGIVIANPNAPTALYADLSVIEDIIAHNKDVIVILDEAYIDFGGASALPLIEKYDNLLVVQTFSKSRSMAGMRIGYAMGNPELIKAMNDVKYSINSYTMNRTAILAGAEAVRDVTYFNDNIQRIIKTRTWTEEALTDLGFSFPKSSANFLFATHNKIPAKVIFQALRERDIYVRYFNAPRIDNYLRITIGTEEDMRKLVEFLKGFIENYK